MKTRMRRIYNKQLNKISTEVKIDLIQHNHKINLKINIGKIPRNSIKVIFFFYYIATLTVRN